MRVLLVQAFLAGAETPVYPLGLSCLASTLKDHEVRIYDPNIEPGSIDGLADVIGQFIPEVVGLSLRNIDSTNKRKVVFYYDTFREMVAFVAGVLPADCKTVIGGSGFSMFAEEIFKELWQIDFGVFREGERVFPALLGNLEHPEKVAGIFYRKNDEIVFTGPAVQAGENDFILPERSLLNPAVYEKYEDAIGVETKRGCNLNCIYCIYSFLNGKKLRLKPVGQVVDDIEAIVESGSRIFTFVDSVFNYPLSHAEDICREIIKRDLSVTWSAWFHEKFVSEEFIRLAMQAGCNKVIFSPDGFSDICLKKLGKNISKKEILHSFDIMRKIEGVEVCFNFFKNPPGQNIITFIQLLLFYFKAKYLLGKRVHFEYNSLRVEPYTKLYDIALKEGVVSPEETLLYPKQYTNQKTWYIEKAFDLLSSLKG